MTADYASVRLGVGVCLSASHESTQSKPCQDVRSAATLHQLAAASDADDVRNCRAAEALLPDSRGCGVCDVLLCTAWWHRRDKSPQAAWANHIYAAHHPFKRSGSHGASVPHALE